FFQPQYRIRPHAYSRGLRYVDKIQYIPFSDLKISIGSPIDYKLLDIPTKEYDIHLESEVRNLQMKSSLL
ncbi:MAG: hypothetical protein K2L98_02675, partial [Bacilli bacterium]|nr:hypothetical protein [Bacilli bacterium]